MAIDQISLSTTPIYLYKGAVVVSQGTGFLYAHSRADGSVILYLLTNHHVLTGYSPLESKPAVGESISFFIHRSRTESTDIKQVALPLYTKNSKPIWLSSVTSPEADLAIIPIHQGYYSDCEVICINDSYTTAGMKIRPATSITLVGYPYGFFDMSNFLPIWKTGNVASEPDIDFDGKPVFMVDVAAFPGMSGSPVFGISYGMYEMEAGGTIVGGARKFLGVYASMQMRTEQKFLEEIIHAHSFGITHEESLQIGHIWKTKLILEVMHSFDPDKYQKEIINNLQEK